MGNCAIFPKKGLLVYIILQGLQPCNMRIVRKEYVQNIGILLRFKNPALHHTEQRGSERYCYA